MIDYREFEHQLIGQWEEVLLMYNIELPKWQGKNTKNYSCPCCGGDDRAHWRETEGRISLYCRNCANDKMKSPEQVIMEVCNIEFPELVSNLADFIGHVEPEDIKRAQTRVAAKPKRNLPAGHKQDHERAESVWDSLECEHRHRILDRFSVQYPYPLKCNDNAIYFDLRNENGALINIAKIDHLNKKTYLAGGVSFGAWHTISKCKERSPDGVAYFISVIKGIHHWWKTGQEVRVLFDEMNLLYMVSCGLIDIKDPLVHIYDLSVEQLPARN